MSIADLRPLRDQAERRREQKAWNWYDWANSAFYTTVLGVLFAPYLITVAGKAAGCVVLAVRAGSSGGWDQAAADRVIDSLEQLTPSLLDELAALAPRDYGSGMGPP